MKSLDETIIEKCKVEDIEHEIEESHETNERAIEIRRRIMDVLAETSYDKSDNEGISIQKRTLVVVNRLLYQEINRQIYLYTH